MRLLNKLSFLPKLFSLFERHEKIQFAGVMISALGMAFFQALGVASILPFMSLLLQPESIQDQRFIHWLYTSLGFTSVTNFLYLIGFILLAIILIGNGISILTIWLKMRFVWRTNHNLSTALLRKYLSLPYAYFLNHHSADLGKNILQEVQTMTSGFLIPLMEIFIQAGIAIFMLTMLFVVEPLVSLLALIVFGGAYGIIFLYLRRKLKAGGRQRLQANEGRYKAASEALTGIKTLKILGKEPFFINRFIQHSQKMSRLMAWNAVVSSTPRYLLEIIAFGGIIGVILVMMSMQQNIQEAIPRISFFAFAGYRLMPALQKTFQSFTGLQFNQAVLDKIQQDMGEGGRRPVSVPNQNLPAALPFNDAITFENISFWYPNTSEPVLHDINLDVKRHTAIAVAGPTGSGQDHGQDPTTGVFSARHGDLLSGLYRAPRPGRRM